MGAPRPHSSPQGTPTAHPRLLDAFAALDAADVAWSLLRGAEELGDPRGDVDLLVAAGDLGTAHCAVAAVGFVHVPAPGRGSHRFAFGYDEPSGTWLKLDVVTEIAYGEWQQLRTGLAVPCLSRRHRDGAVWRLALADELWLRLLHEVLDKRRYDAAAALAGQLGSAPADLAAEVDTRCGTGSSGALLDALGRGDLAAVDALWGRWRRRQAPAAAVQRLRRRLHCGRRWPTLHGPVAAVLGPDGAGKTTLIDALHGDLPVQTAPVYMGLWRRSRWDATAAKVPGARLLLQLGRVAGSVSRTRWHSARGRLVLLDRCQYDALLDDRDDSVGGRITRAAALRLAPTPDVVLVLDAPGSLMHERKQEHTVEVLERRRQEYLALAGRVPGAAVVDATQPAAAVLRRATAVLWQRLGEVAPPAGRARGR